MKHKPRHLLRSFLSFTIAIAAVAVAVPGRADTPEGAPLELGDAHPKEGVMKLFSWLSSSGLFGQDDGNYLLSPEELKQTVGLYKDLPLAEALPAIHAELKRRHPGRMAESFRFLINDAGGALGQVAILYASTKEYLIFFGSPIGMGGFSGRYPHAEFYDIMIDGEMHAYLEGETERHVYRPGDMAVLPRGIAKGYRIPDHGWMLEYSRGNMIELFPFGVIAPAMFLTLDWTAGWAQINDFAKLVIQNAR